MYIKFEAVQLFDWEAEEYVGGSLCPLPSESRSLFNWKFVIVFNSLSKQIISACINPQLQMAKCARKRGAELDGMDGAHLSLPNSGAYHLTLARTRRIS